MMTKSFQNRLFPVLQQIVGRYGTPFHIYDERGIRETGDRLKAAFAFVPKGFQEFYAVKALPHPEIMGIMSQMGFGADCSSIPELILARNAGILPSDIMFTSNNTSLAEFREALDQGGCILNLDDVGLIHKVPKPFPQLVSFRLNPGIRKSGDEVNPIIGNPTTAKYGVPIEEIITAYAKAQGLGATKFGLHTMVCSNDRNYRHMVSTLALLLDIADELSKELKIELEFVNVGGGLGIPYRPGDNEFDIEALGRESSVLLHRFGARNGFVPKFCMESGRYMTGPHGVFVNRVINVAKKYKKFIGVETAMPGLMRHGMYKAYHHVYVLGPDGYPKDGDLEEVSVVGPICEDCDRLATDIMLPPVEEGDFIVTADTGAHGSAMGFNYNGRLRPQELLFKTNGYVKQITRHETAEDLFRRFMEVSDTGLKLSV